MIDEQEFLNDFRAMDDARQKQMAMAIKALATQFPRKSPPQLSLVRSLVRDGLREGLQNYN